MLPVGLLMMEHRIIERLMPPIRSAVEAGRREGRIDIRFVDRVLDFIRTYADRCHHGKEEDILFKALEGKPLAAEHRATLNELVEEHKMGRQKVRELREAVEAYRRARGDHGDNCEGDGAEGGSGDAGSRGRGGDDRGGSRGGGRSGEGDDDSAARDALLIILDHLEFLATFYPGHIQKEDRDFFLPVMDYLDDAEKAAMLEAEREFDMGLIHDLYRERVESIEFEVRHSESGQQTRP